MFMIKTAKPEISVLEKTKYNRINKQKCIIQDMLIVEMLRMYELMYVYSYMCSKLTQLFQFCTLRINHLLISLKTFNNIRYI